MDKHSYGQTTESSPTHIKADPIQFSMESKKSDLHYEKSQVQEKLTVSAAVEKMVKKNIRKQSLVNLEGDTQILLEKMIRDEIQMQGKGNRKMSLDEDETCLCTSDIYTRESVHWKNREINQLTTKKLGQIQIERIKKIKILSQQPMNGYNLFRVSLSEKDVKDFAIRKIDVPLWFGNSLWICLINAGHEANIRRQFQGQIEGQILKKSQFLGNWELRYVHISSKNGLTSCRKKDSPKTVQIKETSQIWTRLETITHQNIQYVIIKTWHMMFKYQFAIPVSDCVRWGKAFSSLLK